MTTNPKTLERLMSKKAKLERQIADNERRGQSTIRLYLQLTNVNRKLGL